MSNEQDGALSLYVAPSFATVFRPRPYLEQFTLVVTRH